MPLPVRSRRYDAKFWEELAAPRRRGERQIQDDLGL
jgi:hypothetical protein